MTLQATTQSSKIFFIQWITKQVLVVACSLIFFACHPSSPGSSPTRSAIPSPAPASVARGKTTYISQCIACHNPDPRKPGALGPEIFGASKALLEARVLHATYPPNYSPKRTTRMMAPLPHLKDEIDSLYLYLNNP